jgi:hypothetical protein
LFLIVFSVGLPAKEFSKPIDISSVSSVTSSY